MKDELPSPPFNAKNYERPNQSWVCGWLRDGHPCPHGPDGHGHCGATPDCHPALQSKEGERELYICARSKERGGPCDAGPQPDGRCGQPPKRCQPQLTLRAQRGWLTKAVLAGTVGLLLCLFYGSWRWQFIQPGELSLKHRSVEFQKMAKQLHGEGQDCATCHVAAKSGPLGWLRAAVQADPAPQEFRKLLRNSEPKTTRIDESCQKCHPQHDFHQPNVAWEYSCSACHAEHRGAKLMALPDQKHCIRCHGNAVVMQAAAVKGQSLPPEAFDFQHDWTRHSFKAPRPTNGYTQVITEFPKDHPDFQIHAGQFQDPNTLRFSHETHRGDNPQMTLLNGKKLDCVFCHQPGPGGVYQKNVTLENNCKVCHQFRFDPENPELTIPHGDAAFAQAFLRSLPQQYANFAAQNKKLTAKNEVDKFVRERLAALRQLYGSGEELEQKVFFGNEYVSPAANVGRLGDQSRSLFPGCAYCHEVKPGVAVPSVTRPVMPERWLNRGRFDHSKHTSVGCTTCHPANASKLPTDILVASKAICASCHRPGGAARHDCFECHSYHHRRETPPVKNAAEFLPAKR